MPVLEIENLRIEVFNQCSGLVAADDISLAVDRGEVLGIVGESGAGKSLLAMSIVGLLQPPARVTGGRIWINGRRIDHLLESQLRRVRGRVVGTIVQEAQTSLNPLYTIGRQLVETIRTHTDLGASAARNQAIACLCECGLPAPADHFSAYPHELSGGMRQRVVIALALCANPRLIIADEPTTALDVSTQAQIIALLRRQSRQHGTAIVLVSHDMGVIAEISDRVAVLYAGRIAELGPVSHVIERPQHPYTAALMQAVPCGREQMDRLAQIAGLLPPLNDIPPGCAFNPRCPRAIDQCRLHRPALRSVGATRVACWLVEQGDQSS